MSAASIATRNAANAKQSTGPVTAEGKARSAQNALKHGLCGRTVVLPYENAEVYEVTKKAFFAQHRPGTELEAQLVGRMVDCWWRLSRALRVEAEYFTQRGSAIAEANQDLSGDAALASLFTDPAESRSYRLFLRYLTNAQNAYRQACSEFQRVKKERLGREHEDSLLDSFLNAPPRNAATVPAKPATSDLASLYAGFVSQSGEMPPPTAADSLSRAA